MDSTFITVAIVGILAVMSPGPDFLIVTRNSLLYSKRVGLATALGIAFGNVFWIAASVFGVSVIIAETAHLFHILKWIGALYLMFLGSQALCSKKKSTAKSNDRPQREKRYLTSRKAFRIGFFTNILNPKCALFFVSFFSLVITPETPAIWQWAYGLEIMVIAVCWFSFVATVLSIERIKRGFERFSHWFDRVTGALLIALGVKVALYEHK
jgi:RhtB (resistance to homoserine/threonine) family protein